MGKYDNKNTCTKCHSKNKIKITDTVNGHISECKAMCNACGFEGYWAQGFFESRQGDESYCDNQNESGAKNENT